MEHFSKKMLPKKKWYQLEPRLVLPAALNQKSSDENVGPVLSYPNFVRNLLK